MILHDQIAVFPRPNFFCIHLVWRPIFWLKKRLKAKYQIRFRGQKDLDEWRFEEKAKDYEWMMRVSSFQTWMALATLKAGMQAAKSEAVLFST